MRPNHDPRAIHAVLDARTWAARRAARLGRSVTPDELAGYVATRHPDVRGEALGYVLTYAEPATRQWPGGPT